MLDVNQFNGFNTRVYKGPETNFLAVTDSTDGAVSTHTWLSQSFGAAHANRIIVCVVSQDGNPNQTFVSATIGGIGATHVVTATDGSLRAVMMFYAAVPTGTSGTIALTISGSSGGVALVTHRLVFNNSATPHDSESGGAAGPIVLNIDVPQAGCLIAGGWSSNVGATTLINCHKSYDQLSFGARRVGGGFTTNLGQESGRRITFDGTGGTDLFVAGTWA